MTIVYIREYGYRTLYVGMVSVVSFSLYIYVYIGAKIRNRLKTAGKRLCKVKDRPAML